MKKIIASVSALLFLLLNLSGCATASEKTANLSIVYGTTSIVSFMLLMGCWLLIREKRKWFLWLFSCVLVVNVGYTLLSLSASLEMALAANRISYLGSVFLPFSMLMIILNITNTKYSKWLKWFLGVLAIIIFLIAASPTILDIYYKEVAFSITSGVSTLHKVYGWLHPIYFIYLFGYFAAMTVVTVRARIKKTIDSTVYAVIVLIAVFVNIGVWFIEQIVNIEFEILSISYIISELFLLGVYLAMSENQRLKKLVDQVEVVLKYNNDSSTFEDSILDNSSPIASIDPSRLEDFVDGINKLTPTERAIYHAYVARLTTKEIMAKLDIKENTLKYHNKNIYGKLGVSSRKELLEIYKHINTIKAPIDEEK